MDNKITVNSLVSNHSGSKIGVVDRLTGNGVALCTLYDTATGKIDKYTVFTYELTVITKEKYEQTNF